MPVQAFACPSCPLVPVFLHVFSVYLIPLSSENEILYCVECQGSVKLQLQQNHHQRAAFSSSQWLLHTHTSGRKKCCATKIIRGQLEEKVPPHIHPQPVVQPYFLWNCRVVFCTLACVYVFVLPSAETTTCWMLEGKKWNTNKHPLWPPQVQFRRGMHATIPSQHILPESAFCLGLLQRQRWYSGRHKTSSFCEARGLWPTLSDISRHDSPDFVLMNHQWIIAPAEPWQIIVSYRLCMGNRQWSYIIQYVHRVNTCCWLWGHTENRRAGGRNGPGGIGRWESSAPPHIRAQTGPRTPRWRTGCSGWRTARRWPSSSGTPGTDLSLAAHTRVLEILMILNHPLFVT